MITVYIHLGVASLIVPIMLPRVSRSLLIMLPRLQVIAKLIFIYSNNHLFIEWLILIIEQ